MLSRMLVVCGNSITFPLLWLWFSSYSQMQQAEHRLFHALAGRFRLGARYSRLADVAPSCYPIRSRMKEKVQCRRVMLDEAGVGAAVRQFLCPNRMHVHWVITPASPGTHLMMNARSSNQLYDTFGSMVWSMFLKLIQAASSNGASA
jgi:hypothetical protein